MHISAEVASHGSIDSGSGASESELASRPEWSAVATVAFGFAAAWLAAGATGLLARPLTRSLSCLLALAAVLPAVRAIGRGGGGVLWLCLGVAGFAVAITSSLIPVNVVGVAWLLGTLAMREQGTGRRLLSSAAVAGAVFAVYRLAVTSIPAVWLAADGLGALLGRPAGWITGNPLWVSSTFGGLDYLVLLAVLLTQWLPSTPAPRWRRLGLVLLAFGAAHCTYLLVLSMAADIRDAMPEVPLPPPSAAGRNPAVATSGPAGSGPSWWLLLLRQAAPWGFPAIALVLHLVVLVPLLGFTPFRRQESTWLALPSGAPRLPAAGWLTVGAAILAFLVPVPGGAWLGPYRLEGHKIVIYEKGFLNWLRPEHGKYGSRSGGMYGLLPDLIASYGGKCVRSEKLTEDELADADVLMVIFPNAPWAPGQLERIWRFVERGGSLLLLGEHTTQEEDGTNRFNDLLRPTAMRVEFDSAHFEVGGWLHCYDPLSHPATAGIGDTDNDFGVVIGASVRVRWPARPLLAGKWGWSDPGDPGEKGRSAMLGNRRYDTGERLGDIVLAAEQPLGKGRIVVFGDTSGYVNGIASKCHVFLARLFAYLATPSGTALPVARQVLALVVTGLAVAGLVLLRRAEVVLAAGLAFGLSVFVCHRITIRAIRAVPDGLFATPNSLAYLDATHLGRHSSEGWRDDGLGGLQYNLNRSGYLVLDLPKFDRERVLRAGLVISVAPSREFSSAERRLVREFVEQGGNFILMAGYEERRASASLLEDFGFRIGMPATNWAVAAEPQPMGYLKVPYLRLSQQRQPLVRFYAGWPVSCVATNARVIAEGRDHLPLMVQRNVGQGRFIVVGDSNFAINKNLEPEDGQAIEGRRENILFWRWFLSVLRGGPAWIPPEEKSDTASVTNDVRHLHSPVAPAPTPPL